MIRLFRSRNKQPPPPPADPPESKDPERPRCWVCWKHGHDYRDCAVYQAAEVMEQAETKGGRL